MSKTAAIREFGLREDDLKINISKVEDFRSGTKVEKEVSGDIITLLARNPNIPLTVRLVRNPKGYKKPMKMFNRDQLTQLASSLGREPKVASKPPEPKKVKRKTKRLLRPPPDTNLCDISGHSFSKLEGVEHKCDVCGIEVEMEEGI